jgi:hypothetical protein
VRLRGRMQVRPRGTGRRVDLRGLQWS